MGGKFHPDVLKRYVFGRVGVRDPSVVVGPGVGEDAAIIDVGGDRVIVVHSDPITGAVEHLGWLAVHIASNDIAVRGVRPRWLLPVLFLHENAGEDVVDLITRQIDEAAKEIGAMVVGGHSEFTPGLARPLISVTAIGLGERGRYVTSSGALADDLVIMTKTVGVEGTAILATDFKDVLLKHGVPVDVIERGRGFLKMVSILREALALAEAGLATAMHDPTEGGLIGGVVEIAYASNKTIEIWEDRIPIAEETATICKALAIDPLKLISSGVLIATIPRHSVEKALKTLEKQGIRASIIGKVAEFSGHYTILHRKNGSIEKFEEPYIKDELSSIWEKSTGNRQAVAGSA